MGAIASQITSLTIVYSTVYTDADQRRRQSSASLAFVRGILRGPVNSPHKWPVTRKMFPFDDVIMITPAYHIQISICIWIVKVYFCILWVHDALWIYITVFVLRYCTYKCYQIRIYIFLGKTFCLLSYDQVRCVGVARYLQWHQRLSNHFLKCYEPNIAIRVLVFPYLSKFKQLLTHTSCQLFFNPYVTGSCFFPCDMQFGSQEC